MTKMNPVEIRLYQLKNILKEGLNVYCPNCGKLVNLEPKNKGKLGGTFGGILSGAYLGSGIGLAAGPLGAIAGTIPGAILGGIFGNSIGSKFDKPTCNKCKTKFEIPTKLRQKYNESISEYERLVRHEDNRYIDK